MKKSVLLGTMEDRNALIEKTCQEIATIRAEQLRSLASSLSYEFENRRSELLFDIAKLEEGGKHGL